MSKKGAPAGKGPVITKGTPQPPRYKNGEAPPLPSFSMTWAATAVGVETVEEGLNPAKVIELVNAWTLPDLSIRLVDAQEMAEEEMFVEDSQLGMDLKAAKKDFTDKKKDPTKESWISPAFLSKLIAVRSSLDQAFEHREEESRRAAMLAKAKQATEESKAAVEAARGQVAASKDAVKALIEQERLRVKAEKEAREAAEQQPPPPPPDPKAKAPPKAKPGAKEPPPAPVVDFKTELPRLRQVVADVEKSLQEAEQKVVVSLEAEAATEASLLSPYVTGRIYWCLGLEPNPSYIANLASDEDPNFGALFNILPEYVLQVPEGAPEPANPAAVQFPEVPVPQLISGMRNLRQTSELSEPARKVAVIDVLYDKSFQASQEPADPKKAAKKPDKKGAADDSTVPYESISKAFGTSARKFLLQLRDYESMKKWVYVSVPNAVPSQEVDMSHYCRLLSCVPPHLTSVPVIMYCMIEQVASKGTDPSQLDNEPICKTMQSIINSSFMKTGHSAAAPGVFCDTSRLGKGADCSSCAKGGEQNERLLVVHEQDRVGRVAATNLRDRLESAASWSTPSILDVDDVERKMLQLLPTPGVRRRGMPRRPILTEERKGAYASALNTASHGFFSETERSRKLGIFSGILQDDNGSPERQRLSERHIIERFSDEVFGQVYSNAKLLFPFESTKYDQDDDCLLSALYVLEGEHSWKNQVHCKVPFGDFCTAEWASELPTSPQLAYAVERFKALVLERMWIFCTKGDGLVRCGLPSAYSLRRTPQTTVYKDGNMFCLRDIEAGSSERCVIASFKDGLILYIFKDASGALTLQVTSPTGRTFELSSSGTVLFFPPVGHAKCCPPQTSPDVNVGANELSTSVAILKREQLDVEEWRCVLPTGTIVRYMKNGDRQLCFANGNFSKWHLDPSGDSSWETTNNEGETVAQFQRKEKPPPVVEAPPPDAGKKDNKKDKKVVEEPPVQAPPEPELPSVITMLPKKVARVTDPDTGVSIQTREDLVIIVNSEDSTRLVQHADGSQIFSTVALEQAVDIVDVAQGGEVGGNSDGQQDGANAAAANNDVKEASNAAVEVHMKEVCRTKAWCAKKEGFPTVHGIQGEVVKVEFRTSWGNYTAGWSKANEQLSVSLPCGSLLLAEGTKVSFKPSDISEPGTKGSEESSEAAASTSSIREWESKNFHLGDPVSERSGAASVNTGGAYVFDLTEGSLTHTDRKGNGFIGYRGTDAVMVVNGAIIKAEPDATQGAAPTSKNVFRWYAGPATRLYAFYEGGHGYEILDEDDIDKYKMAKNSSQCHYAATHVEGDAEGAIFHICVTTLGKGGCCRNLTDASLQCTPFQKDGAIDYAGVFDLSQRDFNLPRVVSPPKVGAKPEYKVTIVMYRQFLEYPKFRAGSKERKNLESYDKLKNVMSELPDYFPKLLDPAILKEVQQQAAVSDKIQEGMSTERFKDARYAAIWEKRFLEDILSKLTNAECQRLEAASRQELDIRREAEIEFMRYVNTKQKIKCLHKPTGLLQKEGPYKPVRDLLLLYFKCEEGLRAVFNKFGRFIDYDGDIDPNPKQALVASWCHVFQEPLVLVKIRELRTSTTGPLKVNLVPADEAQEAEETYSEPVTVRFHPVSGPKPVTVELFANEPVKAKRPFKPVKVRFQEGTWPRRPLMVDLLTREESLVDLAFREARTTDRPVELSLLARVEDQPERFPSPVRVRIQEDGTNGLRVELESDNALMDEGRKKTIEERAASPVKVSVRGVGTNAADVKLFSERIMMDDIKANLVRVNIRDGGAHAARVELLSEPVLMSGVNSDAQAEFAGRADWVAREKEHEEEPVLWSAEELETYLRTSSSKSVWYPNQHALEGRERTRPSLRTASMTLLKRLRPTVDRPQFGVAPELVNFGKTRLGTTAMQVVTVSNFHSDFCRFAVVCEEPCIKVVYDHGPLAAGISRRLKVYLKCSTLGQFRRKVQIMTEFDIFVLPVVAEVVQC